LVVRAPFHRSLPVAVPFGFTIPFTRTTTTQVALPGYDRLRSPFAARARSFAPFTLTLVCAFAFSRDLVLRLRLHVLCVHRFRCTLHFTPFACTVLLRYTFTLFCRFNTFGSLRLRIFCVTRFHHLVSRTRYVHSRTFARFFIFCAFIRTLRCWRYGWFFGAYRFLRLHVYAHHTCHPRLLVAGSLRSTFGFAHVYVRFFTFVDRRLRTWLPTFVTVRLLPHTRHRSTVTLRLRLRVSALRFATLPHFGISRFHYAAPTAPLPHTVYYGLYCMLPFCTVACCCCLHTVCVTVTFAILVSLHRFDLPPAFSTVHVPVTVCVTRTFAIHTYHRFYVRCVSGRFSPSCVALAFRTRCAHAPFRYLRWFTFGLPTTFRMPFVLPFAFTLDFATLLSVAFTHFSCNAGCCRGSCTVTRWFTVHCTFRSLLLHRFRSFVCVSFHLHALHVHFLLRLPTVRLVTLHVFAFAYHRYGYTVSHRSVAHRFVHCVLRFTAVTAHTRLRLPLRFAIITPHFHGYTFTCHRLHLRLVGSTHVRDLVTVYRLLRTGYGSAVYHHTRLRFRARTAFRYVLRLLLPFVVYTFCVLPRCISVAFTRLPARLVSLLRLRSCGSRVPHVYTLSRFTLRFGSTVFSVYTPFVYVYTGLRLLLLQFAVRSRYAVRLRFVVYVYTTWFSFHRLVTRTFAYFSRWLDFHRTTGWLRAFSRYHVYARRHRTSAAAHATVFGFPGTTFTVRLRLRRSLPSFTGWFATRLRFAPPTTAFTFFFYHTRFFYFLRTVHVHAHVFALVAVRTLLRTVYVCTFYVTVFTALLSLFTRSLFTFMRCALPFTFCCGCGCSTARTVTACTLYTGLRSFSRFTFTCVWFYCLPHLLPSLRGASAFIVSRLRFYLQRLRRSHALHVHVRLVYWIVYHVRSVGCLQVHVCGSFAFGAAVSPFAFFGCCALVCGFFYSLPIHFLPAVLLTFLVSHCLHTLAVSAIPRSCSLRRLFLTPHFLRLSLLPTPLTLYSF